MNYDYTSDFIIKMNEMNIKLIMLTNGCNNGDFIDKLALNDIVLLQHTERKTIEKIKQINIAEVLYNESTIDDIDYGKHMLLFLLLLFLK